MQIVANHGIESQIAFVGLNFSTHNTSPQKHVSQSIWHWCHHLVSWYQHSSKLYLIILTHYNSWKTTSSWVCNGSCKARFSMCRCEIQNTCCTRFIKKVLYFYRIIISYKFLEHHIKIYHLINQNFLKLIITLELLLQVSLQMHVYYQIIWEVNVSIIDMFMIVQCKLEDW